MFNDFILDLGIFNTYLTYICLKCLFHIKITLTELPLHNAKSVTVYVYVYVKCVVNVLRPKI